MLKAPPRIESKPWASQKERIVFQLSIFMRYWQVSWRLIIEGLYKNVYSLFWEHVGVPAVSFQELQPYININFHAITHQLLITTMWSCQYNNPFIPSTSLWMTKNFNFLSPGKASFPTRFFRVWCVLVKGQKAGEKKKTWHNIGMPATLAPKGWNISYNSSNPSQDEFGSHNFFPYQILANLKFSALESLTFGKNHQ